MRSPTCQGVAGALTVCLVGVLLAPQAQAAPLELKLHADYGFTVDSNIYRTADELTNLILLGTRQRSDVVQQTTIGADAAWGFSRQKFDFSGWVSRRSFSHFDPLDHTASSMNANWRFEFGRRVSGVLGYDVQRRMTDFSGGFVRSDVLTIQQPKLDVFYALTPTWSLHGRLGHDVLDHNDPGQVRFDRRATRVLLGARYREESVLEVEGGLEYADGKFPGRGAGDPLIHGYSELSPFARARLKFSGVSTFDGRLGYTRRDGRGGTGKTSFGGLTGNVGYERQLSGATLLRLDLGRNVYSADSVASNYVSDTNVGANLRWIPTAKIQVGLRGSRHWRNYQAAGGSGQRDVVDQLDANLSYAPASFATLNFNLGIERRGSNLAWARYNAWYGGVVLRLSWDARNAFER